MRIVNGMVHCMGATCFYATRTHLPKLRFLNTENTNIQACEGASEGFVFASSFPHDTCTCFNAFLLVLKGLGHAILGNFV